MAGRPPVGYAISLKQDNFTPDTAPLNPCPVPVLGKHGGAYTDGGTDERVEAALGKAML